jgi:hypothetical protein
LANCFLVIGNGLFGSCNRRVLFPKDVRIKPPVYRLLVRFQDVPAQAKTGVKKRPIVFVRGVEILDQASNPVRSKSPSLALTSVHFKGDFDSLSMS